MLYSHIHIHNTCGNIVNYNDNFNEWTNILLYKNMPLTLYSRKGWCWLCVRGELETATYWPKVLLTIAAFWLGCLTVGHWGPKALRLLLALKSASCPQMTPTATGTRTDSSHLWHLVIFLFDAHLTPVGVCIGHYHWIQPHPQVKVIFQYLQPDAPILLFFYLFTQVHLLIDSLVKGQYVTLTSVLDLTVN